jgi:hypothetical protein
MVFAVFERNDVAVGWFSKNLQDLAGKHPVVSMQDSRARFYNNSRHKMTSTSNVKLFFAMPPCFDEIPLVP